MFQPVVPEAAPAHEDFNLDLGQLQANHQNDDEYSASEKQFSTKEPEIIEPEEPQQTWDEYQAQQNPPQPEIIEQVIEPEMKPEVKVNPRKQPVQQVRPPQSRPQVQPQVRPVQAPVQPRPVQTPVQAKPQAPIQAQPPRPPQPRPPQPRPQVQAQPPRPPQPVQAPVQVVRRLKFNRRQNL